MVAAVGFEPTHTNIAGLKSAPLDQLGQTAEIILLNIISAFSLQYSIYNKTLNYF